MYWNRGPSLTSPSVVTLNSNIRCIEIIIVKPAMTCVDSWIVTLDVLKFQKNMANMQHIHSWIVTLDVLKWQRYSCKDNCYLVE